MEIWILSHGYDYGDVYDKYKWNEEARFLGAYYSREEGLKALEKYKKIKGFCSHLDGFWLEKCHLDKLTIQKIKNYMYFLIFIILVKIK